MRRSLGKAKPLRATRRARHDSPSMHTHITPPPLPFTPTMIEVVETTDDGPTQSSMTDMHAGTSGPVSPARQRARQPGRDEGSPRLVPAFRPARPSARVCVWTRTDTNATLRDAHWRATDMRCRAASWLVPIQRAVTGSRRLGRECGDHNFSFRHPDRHKS